MECNKIHSFLELLVIFQKNPVSTILNIYQYVNKEYHKIPSILEFVRIF